MDGLCKSWIYLSGMCVCECRCIMYLDGSRAYLVDVCVCISMVCLG